MSKETTEEARARYEQACHTMQSGVAMVMNWKPEETRPKHLRVGVNSALVSLRAMCDVLMAKGVLTEQEYTVALADAMEREVATYTALLNQRFKSWQAEEDT